MHTLLNQQHWHVEFWRDDTDLTLQALHRAYEALRSREHGLIEALQKYPTIKRILERLGYTPLDYVGDVRIHFPHLNTKSSRNGCSVFRYTGMFGPRVRAVISLEEHARNSDIAVEAEGISFSQQRPRSLDYYAFDTYTGKDAKQHAAESVCSHAIALEALYLPHRPHVSS